MAGSWFNWLSKPKEDVAQPTYGMSVSAYHFKNVTLEPEAALRNATVFTCVRILAKTVAQLPWSVVDAEKSGFVPVDHAINKLLKRPNSAMTPFEFKFKIIHDYLVYGNVYLLKVLTPSDRVTELIPLDPPKIEISKSLSGARTFKYEGARTYSEKEIVHIRDFIGLDVKGLSRVEECAELIVQANTLDANLTERTKTAGRQNGVLIYDGSMSPESKAAISEAWKERYGGTMAVLDGGPKFTDTSGTSPADSDTQSLIELEIKRLCGVFDVPVEYLQISDGKFSNLSQKNSEFYSNTISPLCDVVAEKLTQSLIFDDGMAIKFNGAEMKKGDLAATTKIANESYSAGILTLNESRRLAGYSAVDGGDKFVEAPKSPEPTSHNDYDANSTGQYGPRTSEGYSNE